MSVDLRGCVSLQATAMRLSHTKSLLFWVWSKISNVILLLEQESSQWRHKHANLLDCILCLATDLTLFGNTHADHEMIETEILLHKRLCNSVMSALTAQP